ncbi:MAG: type II toxin-antitoxin system RelE/ParE family toxin [Bergeyella sp.]
MIPELQIIWSERAISDLKIIYDWILEMSGSEETAERIRTKIINKSKRIIFPEQYQTDEILGEPYRRMFISHYKIVYKPDTENAIHILKIFDTLQDPQKIKK